VDLTSFCPRGEWGDAIVVQEEWSNRSAKGESARFRCEQTLLAPANGRNDNTNGDLVEGKSRRQDGRAIGIEIVA
jgi:hypothetical protein